MRTRIFRDDPHNPSRKAIKAAADAILRGELVVFPTETVYGIGANAFDARACRQIYKAKGRAMDNPLIVHVPDAAHAERLGVFSRKQEDVLEKIWPGPLTVIVKGRGELPKVVTAGMDSVAIRSPRGKVIREIMEEAGVPIAAPSANISSRPSSTKGTHAINYFNGKVSVIIDCGMSDYGIESTILDLRSFRIMRPGAFTLEEIEAAFGRKPKVDSVSLGIKSAKVAVSPGTKYKHYSPETPLYMYDGAKWRLAGALGRFGSKAAFIGSAESCRRLGGFGIKLLPLGSSKSPETMAHNLFDALIRLDSVKADFGVIEPFEEHGIGRAAMNRIRKATSQRSFRNAAGLARLLSSQ